MKKLFRFGLFVFEFAVLGLAAAFVITVISPSVADRVRALFGSAAPSSISSNRTDTSPPLARTNELAPPERDPANGVTVSYASAVARAAPAVVSITANKVISTRPVLVPANPVLQRMFPGIAIGPATTQRQQSLGSGVIVSSDGYVLTNNHVIEGAEEIQVILYDGRTIQARVIGTDVETDLAVLKIEANNLSNIAVESSKPLNVGDVVLAIGNPFGLSRTVTMGIVSALGRQLPPVNGHGRSLYEDFIQTDAAINQGNSGGALVNAYGELVGINSDVYTPKGGNIGIGFAIPVSTAKAVLDQIVANGRVIRGWLGAEYADVASLQNPATTHGVAIIDVYDKGPAKLAGLRPGDILLEFNDEPITNQLELRNREAALAPGATVKLSGQRNGTPFAVQAVLQERPQRQSSG